MLRICICEYSMVFLFCCIWCWAARFDNKFRGRSPPRECETASAPWRSRPREQGSHATNEFLVVTKWKNQCLTSDLVQTFIFQEAQLEETFPAWVNNFNSSTLWILANEMLLFCSGAGRASKRRLLEMGLWLIYFLPKLISCLSNFLIEFWAWGGCPQGRLLCFWWYRQMQKQPCFHRSFCSTESCDGKVQGTSRCDGGWPGAHGWSMRGQQKQHETTCLVQTRAWEVSERIIFKIHLLGSQDKREKLWSVYAVFFSSPGLRWPAKIWSDMSWIWFHSHANVMWQCAQKPMSARNFPNEKGCQDEMYLLRDMYFASHLFSLFDDMCAGCFCKVTIESMFLPTLQNRQVCLDRPISLEE